MAEGGEDAVGLGRARAGSGTGSSWKREETRTNDLVGRAVAVARASAKRLFVRPPCHPIRLAGCRGGVNWLARVAGTACFSQELQPPGLSATGC